jgi:hypothetical protein
MQVRQGIEVSPLYLEQLVLVATEPQTFADFGRAAKSPHMVFVDWGEEFRQEYARHFGATYGPAITFGDESSALDYILNQGDLGYISLRASTDYLKSGRLHLVTGAPYCVLQVYLTYGISARNAGAIESAISLLRELIPTNIVRQDNIKASLGEVMNRRNPLKQGSTSSID